MSDATTACTISAAKITSRTAGTPSCGSWSAPAGGVSGGRRWKTNGNEWRFTVDLKDKIIESRDAAHAELQQREEQRESGNDRLPPKIVEAIHEANRERRAQMLGAIRMILGRQRLEVGQLRMPPRETHALQALQAAVEGKSADLQQFVYASDRRDLLERALGVLQPDLTRTDDKTARELHAQLADLSERLGQLRHRLSSLEDAQDELLHGHEAAPEIVTAP